MRSTVPAARFLFNKLDQIISYMASCWSSVQFEQARMWVFIGSNSTSKKLMTEIGEILQLQSCARWVGDATWCLPPASSGGFYVRIYSPKALELSDAMGLAISHMVPNLPSASAASAHLFSSKETKRFHPSEQFKFHGSGHGKRKREAEDEPEEPPKTNPVEDLLQKYAKLHLVPEELCQATLKKVQRFQDYGPVAIANAYTIYIRAAKSDVPLLVSACRKIHGAPDILINALPQPLGVTLVASAKTGKNKVNIRTLAVGEILSMKGWNRRTFGLSLSGNPTTQTMILRNLPPKWTVMMALSAIATAQ